MLSLVRDSGCTYHGCEAHAHSVCPAVDEHYSRLTSLGYELVKIIKFLEQSAELGLCEGEHSPAQKKMFSDYRTALYRFEQALNDNEPPRAAGG